MTSSKHVERRTESVEFRDSLVVEQAEVRDTLREVTTITVQTNDRGDTLKVTQVTDRTKIRDANRFRVQDSRLTVKTDTVYVERRDSSLQVADYVIKNPEEKGQKGGHLQNPVLKN